MDVQRSTKVGAPGLVSAVAYHFCPSFLASFTQPGASTFPDLCREEVRSYDADISLLSCPASVADADEDAPSVRPSFLAKRAKCREKNNGDDYAAQLRESRPHRQPDSLSSFMQVCNFVSGCTLGLTG